MTTIPTTPLPATSPKGTAKPMPEAPATWQLIEQLSTVSPHTSGRFDAFRHGSAALISLGLWPLIVGGARQFRAMADDGRHLRDVARWMAVQLSPSEGDAVIRAAVRVRPSRILLLLSHLLGVVSLFALLATAIRQPTAIHAYAALLRSTFVVGVHSTATELSCFSIWSGSLFLAFALQIAMAHRYAHQVRCFLDEFNRITAMRDHLPPVYLQPLGFGCSFAWFVVGIILMLMRQPWAVPFVINGATARRFSGKVWPAVQKDLADRIRMLVLVNPPAARNSTTGRNQQAMHCVTPGCGGKLPKGTRFCGRCGQRATALEPVHDHH